MSRAVRLALVMALIAFQGSGCGFSKRPYAHDPLLRSHAGTWGNTERALAPDLTYFPEPIPPHAPKPAALPTLEWETVRKQ